MSHSAAAIASQSLLQTIDRLRELYNQSPEEFAVLVHITDDNETAIEDAFQAGAMKLNNLANRIRIDRIKRRAA